MRFFVCDQRMQRLHKNHDAYHGETIDIHQTLGQIQTAARNHGWFEESFLRQTGLSWFAFQRQSNISSTRQRRIYISAGIHGDEPAGPIAALRLMQENNWPPDIEITFCPCLNPMGFASNRRENSQGIDLNRDYLNPKSVEITAHLRWLENQSPFDLCLCLHEDWESHGFYVYELNPDRRPSLAEPLVAAVERVCPIDRSEIIEGREARGGIIRPSLDPRTRPLWPEAFWLVMNRTRLCYTLEAPSDFPLETRVDALVAGVNEALIRFAAR